MSGALAAFVAVGPYVKLNASSSPSKSQIGGTAVATFIVNNDGTIRSTGESNYTWLLAGSAASYEARATQQANNSLGTFSGTAIGSWISCSGAPTWTLSRTGVGEATATLLIEIRPVGGAAIASTQAFFDCTVN